MLSRRTCIKLLSDFRAYAAFTLDWLYQGQFKLGLDGRYRFVEELGRFQEYTSLQALMPRATAKSTFMQFWIPWVWSHAPWIEVVYLSATPKVSDDAHNVVRHIIQNSPLHANMRPKRGEETREFRGFNIPGHFGKGMSFRGYTLHSAMTGTRGHVLIIDDLETLETVASDTLRRRMRIVAAEAHNLLYKGKYRWAFSIGTPWDLDSYHSEFLADRKIRIPAWTEKGGRRRYNFDGLGKAELERTRKELNNDAMFFAQYQLEFKANEHAQPITEDMLRFDTFGPEKLDSRLIMFDPAGGNRSSSDRKEIVRGERRGDSKCLVAAGVIDDELYVLDIFAEPCGTRELFQAMGKFIRAYNPHDVFVESNVNAWMDLVRTELSRSGVAVRVEPTWSSVDKHRAVMATVAPLMQGRRVVFHDRLRHMTALRDQLFGLRWHGLPKPHDDVIDTLRLTIERLSEWLFPKREERADDEDYDWKAELRRGNAESRLLRGGYDEWTPTL